jgi:hypothetical protein
MQEQRRRGDYRLNLGVEIDAPERLEYRPVAVDNREAQCLCTIEAVVRIQHSA